MEKITRGYGSIPHLSTSKMTQQADKKIVQGQEDILTKKARDWRDLIIVTEKIDGGNVAVTRKGSRIIAVTRAGFPAIDSPFEHHRLFADFVGDNLKMFSWIPEGWRLCGEWCLKPHGTIYDIRGESPFVVFDIIDSEKQRMVYLDVLKCAVEFGFSLVPLLHIGQPISIKNALKLLGEGHYGKPEKPEGVVYRVERNGQVDFLAKWVRYDKEDGKYMDEDLWNIGVV